MEERWLRSVFRIFWIVAGAIELWRVHDLDSIALGRGMMQYFHISDKCQSCAMTKCYQQAALQGRLISLYASGLNLSTYVHALAIGKI